MASFSVEWSVLTDLPGADIFRLQHELEEIYAGTRAAICSYVLCLGVPQAQAQEVTQDVYVRLYQTMRKGKEILNMRAWLFRVAHNLSLKVRSREKAFRSTSLNWENLAAISTESPERAILGRERMRKLQDALATLSPQQRTCLYLRSEGFRYREIADVMGVSSSSVNEFLRRAIARLSETIDA